MTRARTAKPAPEGYPAHDEALRLHGPGFSAAGIGWREDLRARHGAVAPVLLEGDVPAWLVLGYREARLVAANGQLFGRDCRRWNLADRLPPGWPLLPHFSWVPSVQFAEDEDRHSRASALSDVLEAVAPAELAVISAAACDQLLDGFAGAGRADLITQYAQPLARAVFARLAGMPPADGPGLADDLAAWGEETGAAGPALHRAQARLRLLVMARPDTGGPDLASRLLAHPAGLPADDVSADLLVVMAVGQQATADWIGNALRLMLVDEAFSIGLQGGRNSAVQALNEVLWQDPPVQTIAGRWARQDCELGGQRIRQGDLVLIDLAAANADPQIRPDSAAVTGNRAHLSFGHGDHGCPYPAPELAEVVARTAIESLLDRIPDVELAVPAQSLQWRPVLRSRGLASLPARFTPAGRLPG